MARNDLIGAWGEAQAAEYLKARHYKIIAARYYCRFGEIDLIAANRKYLVFVEVKTRKSARFGRAGEYVNHRKRDRLRMTASVYLEENPTLLQPRFDVIEVYAPEGTATVHPEIVHMEDAFQ